MAFQKKTVQYPAASAEFSGTALAIDKLWSPVRGAQCLHVKKKVCKWQKKETLNVGTV